MSLHQKHLQYAIPFYFGHCDVIKHLKSTQREQNPLFGTSHVKVKTRDS